MVVGEAAVLVMALAIVLTNLLADVINAGLDPRIRIVMAVAARARTVTAGPLVTGRGLSPSAKAPLALPGRGLVVVAVLVAVAAPRRPGPARPAAPGQLKPIWDARGSRLTCSAPTSSAATC